MKGRPTATGLYYYHRKDGEGVPAPIWYKEETGEVLFFGTKTSLNIEHNIFEVYGFIGPVEPPNVDDDQNGTIYGPDGIVVGRLMATNHATDRADVELEICGTKRRAMVNLDELSPREGGGYTMVRVSLSNVPARRIGRNV